MRSSESRRGGFTLIELLVVMAIIGILLALILTAAMDGVRRAEERGHAGADHQARRRHDRPARRAARHPGRSPTRVSPTTWPRIYTGSATVFRASANNMRAQVIAQFDQLKAELPDVFVLQPGNVDYPLNFAAAAYGPPFGRRSRLPTRSGQRR